MIFLTIRTDKPEAEIGLFDGDKQLAYEKWQAHRELAETIHHKIADLLTDQKLTLADVEGVAAYQGPGSFTGLRIGLTVANALAYAQEVPVVAVGGEDWIEHAARLLPDAPKASYAMPEYGGEAHITLPRK